MGEVVPRVDYGLQTFPKYEENGRKQSKSLWSRKRMRNFALRNVEVSLLKTKP